MHIGTAQVSLTCAPATVASVRSEFQNQLPQSVSYLLHNSLYRSTVIESFSNETAWRYLGCLPEITSLTVQFGTNLYSNPEVNTDLPAEWGSAGSFPNLQQLVIKNGNVNGTLPEAWGSPNSFPKLDNLTVLDTPLLEGPLSASWGSNGSFPLLKSLVLHNLKISGNLPLDTHLLIWTAGCCL